MTSTEAVSVGVIMGSDSDWPVMSAAADALTEFDVPHEVRVVSAHRTPRRMLDYARDAAGRGLRVIIAGAGGAAHLPGMVAAATVLPVIGVPVPLQYLDGMDSLLSIVQMPAGIPAELVDRFDKALTEAGTAHEFVTYPGAPHGFFELAQAEHQDTCADAWQRTLAFLARC